ncbi:MAG: hypothetical protein JWQ27_377 [Ferruginibacter sp.]|nr:hypothetical protein [Ferruginibacter sp.]
MKTPYLLVAVTTSLFFATSSCKRTKKLFFENPLAVSTTEAANIPFELLTKDISHYQGRFVETEGIFHWSLEECSLSAVVSSDRPNMFWLSLGEGLNIDLASFEKMDGEHIILRGKIDTASKGQLSQYLARIKQVYYWKVL